MFWIVLSIFKFLFYIRDIYLVIMSQIFSLPLVSYFLMLLMVFLAMKKKKLILKKLYSTGTSMHPVDCGFNPGGKYNRHVVSQARKPLPGGTQAQGAVAGELSYP